MSKLEGEDYLVVDIFRGDMIVKLEANTHKTHWSKISLVSLLRRLQSEVEELEDALINGKGHEIIGEAADVANFAMMIADKIKRKTQHD